MAKIYGKTVKELIKEFVATYSIPNKLNSLVVRKELKDGGSFSKKEVLAWFVEKYPKIREGTISAHLILLSVNAKSRIHYNVHSNGEDDLLFQIDRSNYRLFDTSEDYSPIYKNEDIDTDEEEIEKEDISTFAYEKDLQNYLSRNLNKIESGLRLFQDGDVNGMEYPVGGRFVDILAIDKDKNLVVIELKVSKGYDKVIGQLLRYMAWLEQNQAEENQRVRGMIVCKEISTDLKLACSKIPDVSLYEYDLSVKLRKL